MTKKHKAYFITLLCIINSVLYAQAEMKPINYSQLSEGLWMYTSYMPVGSEPNYPVNGVVAINDKQAVIIDLPINAAYTHALFDWVESQGATVKYVVPQHFHIDSIGGLETAQRRGATTVVLDKTAQLMPTNTAAIDIQFQRQLLLKFGEKFVEFTHFGGGHSKDSVVAWFPQSQVLVGGCLLKAANAQSLGNLADADMLAYPSTLQQLKNKYSNARYVMPGHGDSGTLAVLENTIKLVNKHNKTEKK